jgi:hypothetical protein
MAGLTEDDLTRGWSLAPDDAAEVLRARGTQHRLRCAVQLCTLRATGRFVADYRHVPIEVMKPELWVYGTKALIGFGGRGSI